MIEKFKLLAYNNKKDSCANRHLPVRFSRKGYTVDTQENKQKHHGKKMVAPIVVTVLVIVYFIFYFGWLISLLESAVWKLLLGIVPALFGAVMIGVCIQRIKEIKGGEEDDLGQY